MSWSKSGRFQNVLRRAAVGVIGFVSGFFRVLGWRACRFHPSCSVYAAEAFGQFGFFKACYLAVRRLCRCHPFCEGGYDPL